MRPRLLTASVALILIASGTSRAAEDLPATRRTGGLIRAHYDHPAQASLGFGVIVTTMPANFECKSPCNYRGATIQGAVGIKAGELAIGYGSLVGETGRGDWLLRRVFIGYGVRAALLRRWGSVEPSEARTYWGVEGALTITQFSMTLGVFRPVSPSDDVQAWRVFGGIGWGF